LYCTLLKKQHSVQDVFVIPLDESNKFPFMHHKFALRANDETLIPVNLKKAMYVDQEYGFDLHMDITCPLDYELHHVNSYFLESRDHWSISKNKTGDSYAISYKSINMNNVNCVMRTIRKFLNDFGISNREINISFPNAVDYTQGIIQQTES